MRKILIVSLTLIFGASLALAEAERVQMPQIRERITSFEETREQRISEAQKRALEAVNRARDLKNENTEDIESRREAYMAKVREIEEEQLKDRVETFNNRMYALNIALSRRYIGILSAMEIVLDKIESRTAKMEEVTESSMSSVYQKIDDERRNLRESREEVSLQKKKVYFPDITSEEPLGLTLQNTLSQIREDHFSLRERTIERMKSSIKEIMTELKNTITN